MSDQTYLEQVLVDQTLAEGSEELKELRRRRKEVEELLRDKYGYAPSIRYGGSYQKGTMIKVAYDLDLICYFARDDDSAGSTIEAIYEDVEEVLREQYWTERKGSAIRLRSRDDRRADFHIDVVPGRFVSGKEGDVHLYRSNGDKKYLKTNLETHVSHVQDSGVVPSIRLMKLWVKRRGVAIKTFALELLVIKLLDDDQRTKGLPAQLEQILIEFRDRAESLCIVDPANSNNDLSELLNTTVRWSLDYAARSTLEAVDAHGWSEVFGPVEQKERAAALAVIASSVNVKPRPYSGGKLV